jgi:hypothetical protein
MVVLNQQLAPRRARRDDLIALLIDSPSRCSEQSDDRSILSCAALSPKSDSWLTIG